MKKRLKDKLTSFQIKINVNHTRVSALYKTDKNKDIKKKTKVIRKEKKTENKVINQKKDKNQILNVKNLNLILN